MVDDVVAVRRAGCGLQVGRAVQVRHAEVGEVRHRLLRVGEGEARVELQAVGGAGNQGLVVRRRCALRSRTWAG